MGFKKILIGTLLTMLDFKIQGFDILPDFIGYIIIFIGLSEIVHLNSKFANARFISLILMVLSILDIFQIKDRLTFNTLSLMISTIFNFSTVIIYLIYSYCLFIGIKENAEKISDSNLAEKAQLSWILTIVLSLSGVIILFTPLYFIPFILVIITLIVQLLTLSMAESLMSS